MSEVFCIKTPAGAFVPMDDGEAVKVKRIKAGGVIRMDIVQMRNGRFFRKWWALAKFAFDIWADTMPQQEYKGQEVRPEFDRFRRDLTIMAGYFRPVYAANGDLKLEAESLKWSEMDEDKFERLYSSTINVILSKILAGTKLTEADIRRHVDRLMEFDS